MHKITCPWCGPRAQTEFEYYCDASAVDSQFERETAEEALERVFIRDDYVGFHCEIWQHVHGCRAWLRVERHNRTHEIRATQASRPQEAGRGGTSS